MDDRCRAGLVEADWKDIGVRLAGYASWKARNAAWRCGGSAVLAGGRTAEDIASEAILKVLAGDRGWDPDRGPLLPYLRRVVDSLLSHLALSADNRLVQTDGRRLAAGVPVQSLLGNPTASSDERINELRRALARDRDEALLVIVDAVLAGCEPRPQALAATVGVAVHEINNRLKRLRRRAQSLVKDAEAAREVDRT
jgi:DNA-directed RNA polymerase specialized sigma24 family protein